MNDNYYKLIPAGDNRYDIVIPENTSPEQFIQNMIAKYPAHEQSYKIAWEGWAKYYATADYDPKKVTTIIYTREEKAVLQNTVVTSARIWMDYNQIHLRLTTRKQEVTKNV